MCKHIKETKKILFFFVSIIVHFPHCPQLSGICKFPSESREPETKLMELELYGNANICSRWMCHAATDNPYICCLQKYTKEQQLERQRSNGGECHVSEVYLTFQHLRTSQTSKHGLKWVIFSGAITAILYNLLSIDFGKVKRPLRNLIEEQSINKKGTYSLLLLNYSRVDNRVYPLTFKAYEFLFIIWKGQKLVKFDQGNYQSWQLVGTVS